MPDRLPSHLLFAWRDLCLTRPGPLHKVKVRAENLLAAVEDLAKARGLDVYSAKDDPRVKR